VAEPAAGVAPAEYAKQTRRLSVAELEEYAKRVAAQPVDTDIAPAAMAPRTKHKYYRPDWRELTVAGGLAILLNALIVLLIGTDRVTTLWYVARASGFIVYGLLTISVALGIFMSLKWRPYTGAWLVAERLHPIVLFGAGAFATLHIGGLLLIDFPFVQALVPFTSDYRNLWVAPGVISLYLGVALVLSTYWIGYIGFRVWRFFHYAAFIAWAFALSHGLAAGHDAGLALSRVYYLSGAILVGGLVLIRLSRHVAALRQPVAPAGAGAH